MSTRYALRAALLLALISAPFVQAQEVVRRKKIKIDLVTKTHETPNYLIKYETTIPFAAVERIGNELDDILEQFVRIFGVKPTKKFHAMFLETRNTYAQMGGPPSSAGFYSPSSVDEDGEVVSDRHLYLLQLPFYQLISTAYHEAFHQYIDFYMSYEVDIPMWFNEGTAEYFGEMQRGQGHKAKLDPRRIDLRPLRMAKSAVATRGHIPLEKLVDATREVFYDMSESGKRELHYSQSFSFVFYLMDSLNGKPLLAFAQALRGTKGTVGYEAAYDKIFGAKRKNLSRVESGWRKFLGKVKIPDADDITVTSGKWAEILSKGMNSEYSQERHNALKQVDTNTVDGLRALFGILEKPQRDPLRADWYVREGGQDAILKATSEDARAEIQRLLETPGNPRSKEAVIYALISRIRTDFVRDYGGSDDELLAEAKEKIRKSRGLELISLLLPRVEKFDPQGEKYEWLKLALEDDDGRVRRAALHGLLVYPTNASIPLLLENMERLSDRRVKAENYGEWLLNRFVLEQLTGQFYGDKLEDWKKWWDVAREGFSLEKRVEEELDSESDEGKPRTTVVRQKDIEVKVNMKVAGKKDGYPLVVIPREGYEPDYFRPYFHGIEDFMRIYYLYMPRIGDIKGLKFSTTSNIPTYPTERMAEVLVLYLKETGLDRFALLAHDDEASTLAMYLVAKNPKVISHLIMINPRSSGMKRSESFKRVQGLGRQRANRELVKGIDNITIKQDGNPVYEATDAAEKAGFSRALRNIRFGDPTSPEVGSLWYLYGLSGGTTAMIDEEWSMFKIFGKKKPRLPTLVCVGEQDGWVQAADMNGVKSFFRGTAVRFRESGLLPFITEPYKFTQTIEGFFKKYPPPRKRASRSR